MSVTIEVNGRAIACEPGALLIDVLKQNDIFIPHFCYHEALGPDGNCRMCMVKIEGQKRPQIACDTFVTEGLIVNTEDEAIRGVNRNILELELINHPVDCPICDQAGECSLQDYYMEYGLYDSRLETPKNLKKKHVDLGSNVVLDQERCVLCARCTRFTQEITKTSELAIMGRGDHACVSTVPGRELSNPYAMNVVDLCPVGALTSKDFRFAQRVWFMQEAPSICHGCSRGCNVWIDHNKLKYADEKVYRFRPRVNDAVNGWFICDEGRLSYKQLNQTQRPELNEEKVEQTKALDALKTTLENGKDGVMTASANLSVEQLASIKYLAQRFSFQLFSLLTIDEEFGDDWLRHNVRSANASALNHLDISSDQAAFEKAQTSAKTIIRFDDDAVTFTSDVKTGRLPFANFAYDCGTLINCDGVIQRFDTTGEHDNATLLQLLHAIDKSIAPNASGIWNSMLTSIPAFAGLTFDALKTGSCRLLEKHDA